MISGQGSCIRGLENGTALKRSRAFQASVWMTSQTSA